MIMWKIWKQNLWNLNHDKEKALFYMSDILGWFWFGPVKPGTSSNINLTVKSQIYDSFQAIHNVRQVLNQYQHQFYFVSIFISLSHNIFVRVSMVTNSITLWYPLASGRLEIAVSNRCSLGLVITKVIHHLQNALEMIDWQVRSGMESCISLIKCCK